jgi:alpha/beta superfamily hydrolase
LNFGINIVLWNYRGYGKSTGSPSPEGNRADIELVYHWARQKTIEAVRNLKPIKIGVHGISIGGLAASHLGRIGAVDFLFMDRTFSDLQSIPR